MNIDQLDDWLLPRVVYPNGDVAAKCSARNCNDVLIAVANDKANDGTHDDRGEVIENPYKLSTEWLV